MSAWRRSRLRLSGSLAGAFSAIQRLKSTKVAGEMVRIIAMWPVADATTCWNGGALVSTDARTACKRIYTLLAADDSIMIGPAIALPQLVQWADGDVEREAARGRLRQFAWVYENVMQLYQRPAAARHLPADYVDVFLRDGELAAMRWLVNGK